MVTIGPTLHSPTKVPPPQKKILMYTNDAWGPENSIAFGKPTSQSIVAARYHKAWSTILVEQFMILAVDAANWQEYGFDVAREMVAKNERHARLHVACSDGGKVHEKKQGREAFNPPSQCPPPPPHAPTPKQGCP